MHRRSVSISPSEIPYGGFSPVRLQGSGTAQSHRARPARGSCRFDARLVLPRLHDRWFPLSASRACRGGPRVRCHTATPRVLCSPGFCCPSASSLLRPDPPISPSPIALLAACATGLATMRPSLLWVTDHSPDAATHVPEQAPTALARCLRRCPSAFAHAGMGSAARLTTTRFSWLAVSTLQCSLSAAASGFARPPDGSDRHRRPRGLSSELAPSPVARCECQMVLRSRTGQLLRRDLHPRGQRRYRLHPALGSSRGWSDSSSESLPRVRDTCLRKGEGDEPRVEPVPREPPLATAPKRAKPTTTHFAIEAVQRLEVARQCD